MPTNNQTGGDAGTDDADSGVDPDCVENPEDCGWEMISGYTQHVCGIHQSGALFCWGNNEHGQLGVGDEDVRSMPTHVNPGERYQHVATAMAHTCAVTLEGRMQCWGQGEGLRLGQGVDDQDARNEPAFVGTDSDWTKAFAGGSASCGLRGQTLWCWGSLNNVLPEPDSSHLPQQVPGDWNHLSMASSHQCGVQGSELYCWGFRGSYGRLGDGVTESSTQSTPLHIATQEDWDFVDAGGQNGCAIRNNGSLWCWGDGTRWKLGNDSTESSPIPVQTGTDSDWRQVSVGGQVCAIKDGGELYCWGSGSFGALGRGDDENQPTPARVALPGEEPSLWHDVATGFFYACAIHEDRSLWCWGRHTDGVTGLGNTSNNFIATPQRVLGYEFQ